MYGFMIVGGLTQLMLIIHAWIHDCRRSNLANAVFQLGLRLRSTDFHACIIIDLIQQGYIINHQAADTRWSVLSARCCLFIDMLFMI